MSVFVTLPGVFFLVHSVIKLVRFHLNRAKLSITEVTSIAYLCIWLVSIVSMFSLLNIVVGTHYHLPLAPPVALAGAYGIIALVRFISKAFQASHVNTESHIDKGTAAGDPAKNGRRRIKFRSVVVPAVLFVLF